MTSDLISKKTRNEFREFLVSWSLREIGSEFEAAGIECDRDYDPATSGQRRSFIEQHYHSLNLADPKDALRLVVAFAGILATAEKRLPTQPDRSAGERAIADLVAGLKSDGLKYEDGKIIPISPTAKRFFQAVFPPQTVSEVTRRNIIDELFVLDVSWAGRLDEADFLARLYDLERLSSSDPRFKTFAGDVWQHRVNNHDWEADWVFTDSRIDLLHASDDEFLRFLCEMVHPAVRTAQKEVDTLIAMFNKHLAADRWEIAGSSQLSGRSVYSPRRQATAQVRLTSSPEPIDVLSNEYVQELARKCDERLERADFDGAITTGRTVLEAILVALEEKIAGVRGDYKGDLPRQFKKVAKLLKMDDERPDLDARFKDVVRGLVMVTNGLAPLRNKMSDGHARERKPAPHHARVVVNAAKTVAAFLVESYVFQCRKGLLAGRLTEAGDKVNS